MRRAAKVDENHAETVHLLRTVGCSVESLHRIGGGVPDLLVGFQKRNLLLEVKSKGGDLNVDQRIWHRCWNGHVATVWTFDDCLKALGL